MIEKRRVLVFGRSLNLAGLTACLRQDSSLDVLFLDPKDPACKGSLDDFNPETILFDLSDPPDGLDLRLLRKRPGVLLVGVDPCSDEVLVLSGRRSKVLTAGELAQLITHHSGRKKSESRRHG